MVGLSVSQAQCTLLVSLSQCARLHWFLSRSVLGFVGSFSQCARICWFLSGSVVDFVPSASVL